MSTPPGDQRCEEPPLSRSRDCSSLPVASPIGEVLAVPQAEPEMPITPSCVRENNAIQVMAPPVEAQLQLQSIDSPEEGDNMKAIAVFSSINLTQQELARACRRISVSSSGATSLLVAILRARVYDSVMTVRGLCNQFEISGRDC
jgi:hypothetical protein